MPKGTTKEALAHDFVTRSGGVCDRCPCCEAASGAHRPPQWHSLTLPGKVTRQNDASRPPGRQKHPPDRTERGFRCQRRFVSVSGGSTPHDGHRYRRLVGARRPDGQCPQYGDRQLERIRGAGSRRSAMRDGTRPRGQAKNCGMCPRPAGSWVFPGTRLLQRNRRRANLENRRHRWLGGDPEGS
jgi:hypothetical protein